jgi:hypothetical protein
VAMLKAEQDRFRTSSRYFASAPGTLAPAAGIPAPLQEPPSGQQILLPKWSCSHLLLVSSPLQNPRAKCTPPCSYRPQRKPTQKHHRLQMSALQRQATSSLLTDLLNCSFWSTWVPTAASTSQTHSATQGTRQLRSTPGFHVAICVGRCPTSHLRRELPLSFRPSGRLPKNRLLDGITSLPTPAKAASANIPNVKSISDVRLVVSLLE